MARQITFVIDCLENAGPTDVYRGDIDLDESIGDDPLIQLAIKHGSVNWMRGVRGLRFDFQSEKMKNEWLTMAAIKYGLSK